MKRIAIALLAAVLLAGCGSDDGATTSRDPRVPGPTDTLLTFERSGGLAAVQHRLAVRPDGAVRLDSGFTDIKTKRFKLTDEELNGLRAAREGVDFSTLDKSYGPEQPVADGIATTIRADGREVTVLTEGDPPPELARLIAVCAGIVDQHG